MKNILSCFLSVFLIGTQAYSSAAGDAALVRGQLTFVYQRLAGVRPSEDLLQNYSKKWMEAKSGAAKEMVLYEVADAATQVDSFYTVTVYNFIQPETNKEQTIFENSFIDDISTTAMGMIRDGKDYRLMLSGDIVYTYPGPVFTSQRSPKAGVTSTDSNSFARSLTETTQSSINGINIGAGIFTLEKFAAAYYSAGTNRAPVRATFLNYLCRDIQELADVTRPDSFVRRDVERNPGGNTDKYKTECAGCHAGMDPLSHAFAFLDYAADDDDTKSSPKLILSTTPVAKMNKNAEFFPQGYVVADDRWHNLWNEGTNKNMGWDPSKLSGKGPKSFGESIAASPLFPECMAKRVFQSVCLNTPVSAEEKELIRKLSGYLVSTNYNMKDLFKLTTIECARRNGL